MSKDEWLVRRLRFSDSGQVVEEGTFATEAELNGFRLAQAAFHLSADVTSGHREEATGEKESDEGEDGKGEPEVGWPDEAGQLAGAGGGGRGGAGGQGEAREGAGCPGGPATG